MNISCIILNYNDAETTISLVNSIINYKTLDSIVVVDNCSADDSLSKLKRIAGGRIHVIASERNGGYGYGNNLGIRYAYGTLHASHVLIANPDVKVSEDCIKAMKDSFLKLNRLGVAAAVTRDGAGTVTLSSWRINGLAGDLLDTGLITRRLFAPWLNDRPELQAGSTKAGAKERLEGYPAAQNERQEREDERYVSVDAVPGSLFMADIHALMDCGLYDEEVFLYYEEKILGYQLKKMGYQTVLLLDRSYVHLHSVSIDKSVKSILKKQALLHKSKLHYYKKYLKINRFQECLVRAFLGFLMGEIWFLTKILGLSW
ncbi:glycosyltransferase family 2 protein [Lacrimispora saccharolytica]|uniref:Glycosyl transferase family 2 n=1 Tax=Lacrimispora saccharolytica (strain ATCC 35040 / DSM 2544 / NRCC 2533 / WM1) TaxID=610130 RepID=D9R0B7_LACSW|nr:glycosyltransferase [Lacrimispora saccharolytica]ADL06350.1 glycosyl transferase family 2 [[Clostridium] saccharolyticum WM1]QRV19553.1 glycosyltransferase family 2 protein [Lacrimispora saccharolytica]